MKPTDAMAQNTGAAARGEGPFGLMWLAIATLGAVVFFYDGIEKLFEAWQTAEYSHGPLIPLLSGFLFLRQMKTVPAQPGPLPGRWQGVAVLILALAVGLLGRLAHISDVVAYALIIWVAGIVLISFGWKRGLAFWPPVLHLVFMLPLPGTIYYKVSTSLQFVSSELGVWVLQRMGTPVFLDGNIIDLGTYQLHVAEACSGLRYMFPIMSFSYIFAVLYRGPTWHKAVLLLSAVPIAVVMNSVRIAIVGVMVNAYGIEQAEGLSHLMEGWVVFMACILILFALAWVMLRLQSGPRVSLADALDLDLNAIVPELARLRFVMPSRALITATVIIVGASVAWTFAPERDVPPISREQLAGFPRDVEGWQAGAPRMLEAKVEKALGADDYLSLNYAHADARAGVEMFVAWYQDQTKGGIHSPEVCLPGGGWEMTSIKTVDLGPQLGIATEFNINRAVINKGMSQLLVYYWFDQTGHQIASDFLAKGMLVWSGITEGRTDGALVRLTTPILPGEREEAAEARMLDLLKPLAGVLPDYVNGR
jgi:exosortase D (VPLPA-CTERM-specific)